MLPPKPCNDAERLAALHRYGILDTPVEAAFDDITRLAASICATPIAVINFIDEGRQWFKSEVGLGVRETPLDTSICAYAILRPGLTVIANLEQDARFARNPLVTGRPKLRFYAGAVLLSDDNYPIGTLCVLDVRPRELTVQQEDALAILARQVVAQLELRRQFAKSAMASGELQRAQDELRARDEQLRLVLNRVPALISYIGADGRYRLNNDSYQSWFGKPSADFAGKTIEEMLGARTWQAVAPHFEAALRGMQSSFESEFRARGRTRWVEGTYTPHFGPQGRVQGVVGLINDITEHKLAEAALRQSERRFRTVATDSTTTIWSAGPDGAIIQESPGWEAFTGQALADYRGFGWVATLHPDDKGEVLTAWREALRKKLPVHGQYRLRGRDGEYRHVEVHGSPLTAADGSIEEWVGTITDIHDRVEAEQALHMALKELESQVEDLTRLRDWSMRLTGPMELGDVLREIVEAITALQDTHMGALYVTDSLGEGIALAYSSGLDEAYEHAVQRLPAGAGASGTAFQQKRRVIIEDTERDPLIQPYRDATRLGGYRAVHCVPLITRDSKVLGVVATYFATPFVPSERQMRLVELYVRQAADFMEAARLHDELARGLAERERLMTLVERSQDFIGYGSMEGRTLYVNEGGRRLVGLLSAEEMSTTGILDFLTPEWQRHFAEVALPQVLATGHWEGEPQFRHFRTGAAIDMWESIFTVPDPETGSVCFATIARDITERKRAEAALVEADQRKDQFLATLAHELRNPLAPISNALALWPMVQEDRTQMDKLHAMMGRQVHQMTRLIDDLLDVSRITRGKITLRPQRIDVAAVINNAVEAARPFIERQRHQLNVVLPNEPLAMEADVARLLQVFGNILTNAAKYTPPGGIIWMIAEKEADEIVVRVRDNGPGIPSNMLPKIFDMFVQVDSSLERSYGGLGIGLTLVKTLVEMHGGKVEAKSEGMGAGSEFIVRLPVAEGGAEAALVDKPHYRLRKVAAARRRVLVVDDVEASASTLSLLLQSIGHDTRLALDGIAAIAVARAYLPEVILLDIAMPGMNGYEVARRLRGEPGLEGVRIIALTGFGQEEDQKRASEAGFDHHLVKPCNVDQLEALLADLPAAAAAAA